MTDRWAGLDRGNRPFEELPPEKRARWKDRAEYENWKDQDEWAHHAMNDLIDALHSNRARNDLVEMYCELGDDQRFKEHGCFSHLLAYRRLLYCARQRGYLDKENRPPGPDELSPDEEMAAGLLGLDLDDLDTDDLDDAGEEVQP